MRRRLESGLLGEPGPGSGRLKRGEGRPESWRLNLLGELSVSDATLAAVVVVDDGRWRYAALPVGLLVGGLPRPRMKRPAALAAEFGGCCCCCWPPLGEYGVAGLEDDRPGPDIIMTVEAAMLRRPHF